MQFQAKPICHIPFLTFCAEKRENLERENHVHDLSHGDIIEETLHVHVGESKVFLMKGNVLISGVFLCHVFTYLVAGAADNMCTLILLQVPLCEVHWSGFITTNHQHTYTIPRQIDH